MRALVMMLVLLAALGAGGYFYWQNNPNAFAPKSTLTPPAPPPRAAKAEDCPAGRARYEFANDTRFTLHFERVPSHQAIEIAEFQGHRLPNLTFVVHVSTLGLDTTLTPASGVSRNGPSYSADVLSLRAEGVQVPVYMFDSDMRYLSEWLRDDSPAPASVFMPEVMRVLYAHHVNMPPAAFVFRSCAPEATPAAAPAP